MVKILKIKFKILFTSPFLLLIYSCLYSNNKINEDCIQLNNKALTFLNMYELNLDSANYYCDLAIQCDSSYFLAYSNKLAILNQRKDYVSGIDVLDLMIRKLNIQDNRFALIKGNQYWFSGQEDSAVKYYNLSLIYLENNIQAYPDSFDLCFQKALVLDKLYNKVWALNYLDSLISKNPSNNDLLFYKEAFLETKKSNDTGPLELEIH